MSAKASATGLEILKFAPFKRISQFQAPPGSSSEMEQTLQLQPDSPLARDGLGRIYVTKGMYKEAIEEFKKLGEHVDGIYASKPLLANAYATSGQTAEAERLLSELKKDSEKHYVAADQIGRIYVGLGKHEEALTWLERGYEERPFGMFFLKVDPSFALTLRPWLHKITPAHRSVAVAFEWTSYY